MLSSAVSEHRREVFQLVSGDCWPLEKVRQQGRLEQGQGSWKARNRGTPLRQLNSATAGAERWQLAPALEQVVSMTNSAGLLQAAHAGPRVCVLELHR